MALASSATEINEAATRLMAATAPTMCARCLRSAGVGRTSMIMMCSRERGERITDSHPLGWV